jgi:hypothetical protein
LVEQQAFNLVVMGSSPIILNMKKVNHIILDFEENSQFNLYRYWTVKFLIFFSKKQIKYFINKSFSIFNLININFLRKEYSYTKLKYSRSPAYDIVSGGAAAMFAGFLGFLISEKFGLELVDSGDFYYIIMYLIFVCFIIRIFLNIFTLKKPFIKFNSYKIIYNFYISILKLFILYF